MVMIYVLDIAMVMDRTIDQLIVRLILVLVWVLVWVLVCVWVVTETMMMMMGLVI